MSKNSNNNKAQLHTISKIKKEPVRCSFITPCADAKKTLVSSYKTVAIKFKDRSQAISLANEIIMMANTPEMDIEQSVLNITAYRKISKRKPGHHVTVTLTVP